MPKSYFDYLIIEDFGPFYGRHTFNFTTTSTRPIILIVGENGVGKTHVLRAFYLAVGETNPFILEKSLNRRAESEGRDTSRVEIGISQWDDMGRDHRKFKLIREIHHRRNSSPTFASFAECDGDSQVIKSEEHIQRLCRLFFPWQLSSLFFFDGEDPEISEFDRPEMIEGIRLLLGNQNDAENRLRISTTVSELWLGVMGRKESVKLSLDDQWRWRIYDQDGQEDSLRGVGWAKGEQRVLSLAIVEALRRLALLQSPMVADSPVDCLDADTIDRVISTFFVGGHQTILVCGKTQIVPGGMLFNQMKSYLASVYILEPHKVDRLPQVNRTSYL